MNFSTGDRILTPSQRAGTIQPAPWPFPGHTLVAFDAGETHWILTELLSPLPEGWKPLKKTCGSKATA